MQFAGLRCMRMYFTATSSH